MSRRRRLLSETTPAEGSQLRSRRAPLPPIDMSPSPSTTRPSPLPPSAMPPLTPEFAPRTTGRPSRRGHQHSHNCPHCHPTTTAIDHDWVEYLRHSHAHLFEEEEEERPRRSSSVMSDYLVPGDEGYTAMAETELESFLGLRVNGVRLEALDRAPIREHVSALMMSRECWRAWINSAENEAERDRREQLLDKNMYDPTPTRHRRIPPRSIEGRNSLRHSIQCKDTRDRNRRASGDYPGSDRFHSIMEAEARAATGASNPARTPTGEERQSRKQKARGNAPESSKPKLLQIAPRELATLMNVHLRLLAHRKSANLHDEEEWGCMDRNDVDKCILQRQISREVTDQLRGFSMREHLDRARNPTHEEEEEGDDSHGHCLICFRDDVRDPVACQRCRQFVGCRGCCEQWYRESLASNSLYGTCSLCRRPWVDGPEVIPASEAHATE